MTGGDCLLSAETKLSRRGFIAGLLASVAIPVIPTVPLPLTNLIHERLAQVMSQRIIQTIIYGNPEWEPTQFTGVQLSYPMERC